MADLSAADVGALMGGHSTGMSGGLGLGAGILGGLFLGSLINGGWGFGNRGGYNAGFANAIGYENLATSNEVQRGFDNQNSMANQREILGAVNQNFHDTLTVLQDKYGEIARDIAAVQVSQAQALANQNQCCCDTKMLIQETSAQNRYDALQNTNAVIASLNSGFNDIKATMAQDKIEALQNRIQQLELARATDTTVKYPTSMSYDAGRSPFCNNGYGCGCGF